MIHTPGPWKVADTSIVAKDHCIAVIEDDGEYAADSAARRANARLIAAAPELLEACRVADQLASIASDWNLHEVEIDGEMKEIYKVKAIFTKAMRKAGLKPTR